MFIRLCLTAFLAFHSLPALATKSALPFPLADPLQVELVLSQQELAVDVPDTSAATMQFGLLGAVIGSMVESAQVSNAERRIAQIRDLLIDYPFNTRFEQVARDKLTAEGITSRPQISILAVAWNPTGAKGTMESTQDVLVLHPRYSMLNNFESMSVKMVASFASREPRPDGKIKVGRRFGREYTFNFPMEKIAGSGADLDAQRWLAMGSDSLRKLLDHGIEQVTDMLVYDLSSAGRSEASVRVQRGYAVVRGKQYPGRTLRENEDWVWVRRGNGILQSIQGFQPITGETFAVADPLIPPPVTIIQVEAAVPENEAEYDASPDPLDPTSTNDPIPARNDQDSVHIDGQP